MATSLINTECKRYGCMKNLLACYANCRYNSRCDDLRNEILPNLEQAVSDINGYRREREQSVIEIQLLKRGLKFVDVASLQKNLAKAKRASEKASRKRIVGLKPAKVKPAAEALPAEPVPTKRLKQAGKAKPLNQPASRIQKVSVGTPKRPEPEKRRRVAVVESSPAPVLKRLETSSDSSRSRLKKKRKKAAKKPIVKLENRLKMAKKIKDSATASPIMNNETSQLTGLSGTDKSASPRPKKSAAQEAAKKKKRMFIILDGERSALVDEKGLMAKLLAGVSPNARYFEATEIELRLQIAHKK
jgi:hypothetical protein